MFFSAFVTQLGSQDLIRNIFTITSVYDLLAKSIGWGLIIGAVLVFGCIVITGIQLAMSGNDSSKTKEARDHITNCIFGFGVLSTTWAIALVVQAFLGIEVFQAPGTTYIGYYPPGSVPLNGPCTESVQCADAVPCSGGICQIPPGSVPDGGGCYDPNNCVNNNCQCTGICSPTNPGICVKPPQPNGSVCSNSLECQSNNCLSTIDSDNDKWVGAAIGGQPGTCGSKAPDCNDSDPNVYPGQFQYFTTADSRNSFDYDCNGTIRKNIDLNCKTNISIIGSCITDETTINNTTNGYINDPPECGQFGDYVTCDNYYGPSCNPSGGGVIGGGIGGCTPGSTSCIINSAIFNSWQSVVHPLVQMGCR